MNTGSSGAVAALSCVVLLAPAAGFAQGTAQPDKAVDAGRQLTEIVVTAQKREQKSNQVGISITALPATQLAERGVTELSALTRIEPSLQYSQSTFGTPVYTIRGVGYFEESLAATPSVSLYQDEVPYTYPSLARGALLDPERVEILKGPQGTVFGQNATGGAVNFIAAKPRDYPTAGIDFTVARFGSTQVTGFVSGPLTPDLTARIAFRNDAGGAWQHSNTRDDTLGDKDTQTGRLMLDWKPSDAFTAELNLNGWVDHSDSQAAQVQSYRILDPQYVGPTPLGLTDPRSYLPNPSYFANYPKPLQQILSNPIAPHDAQAADWKAGTHPRNDESYIQPTLRMDYAVSDELGFTALMSYENYHQADQRDLSGVNTANFQGVFNGDVRSIFQEFRAHGALFDQKLEWLVGENYSHDKTGELDVFSDFVASASYATGGTPYSIIHIAPFGVLTQPATTDAETKSAFANFDYHILPEVTLHGGIRYTKSDQNFAGCSTNGPPYWVLFDLIESLHRRPIVPAPGPDGCITITRDFTPGYARNQLSQSNVPWRASIDYSPIKDSLLYFTVSKGYKQGSAPDLAGSSYIQFTPVTQEALLSYELGVKSALFDHTLQVNAAIFHYDYTNKQILGRIVDPLNIFGALGALVNVPRSQEDGAELSTVWRPTAGLTLNAAVTYLDSRVESSFFNYAPYAAGTADRINFQGESFPFTPKWSLAGGARYDWSLSDRWNAYAAGSVQFQTKTVSVFGAQHAAAEGGSFYLPSYGLLDLSVGVQSSDGRWRAELWGRNVTNTYYWHSDFYLSEVNVREAGMPATYGLTVGYRY